MAIVQVVIGLLHAFADLGISAAIVQRQNATHNELSSLYWLSMAVGVCAFGLLAAVSPAIAVVYRDPRLTRLLTATALSFLVAPIGAQFHFLLLKELRFGALAVMGMTTEFVRTAVTVTLAVSGAGVWALVWGQLSGTVVYSFALLAIGLREFRPRLRFAHQDLRGYLRFGMFEMASRAAGFAYTRIDQLLLGLLLGMQSLGYYNFAYNWSTQLRDRMNPILTKVAFPVFAKVQHDGEKVQRGYLKALGLVFVANSPLQIGMAALAAIWVPCFFGEKWLPSVPILQTIAMVMLVRCTLSLVPGVALAKGHPDQCLYLQLLRVAVYSCAVCVGAAWNGALGAAIALLVGDLLLLVPAYRFFVRPLVGIGAGACARAIARPLLAGMVMGAAVLSLVLFGGTTVLWLLMGLLLGGVIYASLLYIFDRGFADEMKGVLLSLLPARTSR